MTEAEPARSKRRRGRPSKFKPEYVEQVKKLCEVGQTDQEIADFLNINVATLYRWKNEHPEFCDAISDGKDAADDRVKRTLFQRAVGYERKAVKIFMPSSAVEPVYADYQEHVPADVNAAKFWLSNRQGWSDKQQVDGNASVTINLTKEDMDV